MISPTNIRALLGAAQNGLSFIETHILSEAYLRRLVYLGCRRLSFAHYDAQHIATYQFIRSNRLYTTLFEMLSGSATLASTLRHQNRDFDELIKLYEEYSSIYRNRIVHGAATLSVGSFAELLRHIDISFVREFERVIQSYFGHSAFDSPQQWGFPLGTPRPSFAHTRQHMAALATAHRWSKTFGGEKILNTGIDQHVEKTRLRATAYGVP
jgi:hypothetical protein